MLHRARRPEARKRLFEAHERFGEPAKSDTHAPGRLHEGEKLTVGNRRNVIPARSERSRNLSVPSQDRSIAELHRRAAEYKRRPEHRFPLTCRPPYSELFEKRETLHKKAKMFFEWTKSTGSSRPGNPGPLREIGHLRSGPPSARFRFRLPRVHRVEGLSGCAPFRRISPGSCC